MIHMTPLSTCYQWGLVFLEHCLVQEGIVTQTLLSEESLQTGERALQEVICTTNGAANDGNESIL